jgi:cobalt-zinc-cadmium efflux system outer membrane protein
MRFILLTGLCLAAGCTGPPLADDVPAPRSLARDLPIFAAPAQPGAEPNRPVRYEPTGALTLQQALALALLYNPRLEAYAWSLRAREAAILQNHLRPNPVLGLKVENVAGQDALSGFDGAVSTLAISQAVELGDRRRKRTLLAQQEHALAAWDYEAQRLQVIAQTGQRYIAALAAQQEVALAEESLHLAQDLYRVIEDRAAQGVIPTVEREKARVQLSRRRIDLEKRVRQHAALRQQLASLWEAPSAAFQRLDGDLQAIAELPAYEDLIGRLEQNPDLARWSTELAARRAAIELADSGAFPDLTLGAGVRRFNLTDNHALVFEMGIPLPLANRNQGSRNQARYLLQQARARQRHAQTAARAQLHELVQDLGAAHYAAVTLRDESLPAARAAFDAARRRFDQGVTDYLHVLDAERTYIETRYESVDALRDYHQTLTRIEAFLGMSLAGEGRDEDRKIGR